MNTKAMIMAAGLGKRMRPLTEKVPKPLIPVAGKALIDRALDWVSEAGITEVVVNTHYKADMLEAHLATRSDPQITCSREEVLLETGGGIKKALPLLGNAPFFVVNSDVICMDGKQPVLWRLKDFWQEGALDALLLVHPVTDAIGYDGVGDFFVNEQGDLRRRENQPSAPFVFTGVQLLHPRLFDTAPDGIFSLNLLYDQLLKNGQTRRIRALIHDSYWLHVGDLKGLKAAEAFFRQ